MRVTYLVQQRVAYGQDHVEWQDREEWTDRERATIVAQRLLRETGIPHRVMASYCGMRWQPSKMTWEVCPPLHAAQRLSVCPT